MAQAAAALAEPAMTPSDAKQLTARIKRGLGDLQQRGERLLEMIRRANREGAWRALDYDSWDAYLAGEFPDLSRGQKYRLAAWGEIAAELGPAADAVPVRQAPRVRKEGAAKLAERVKERLADKPDPTDEDRREAVAAALAEPIEATATKVEPPATEPTAEVGTRSPEVVVPLGSGNEVEQVESAVARARATESPAPPTAGELLRALAAFDATEAAETVELSDLDALAAWTGLVRAAVRRRKMDQPAPAKAAAKPASPPAATETGGSVAAKDCKHPPGRMIAGTCTACGTKVSQR